jgi:hypothetical protein
MQRNSRPPSKRRELAPEQEAAEQEHRLATKTAANTERLMQMKATNPHAAAAMRTASGMLSRVPLGKKMSLAMTAARIAVATARDQTTISESSLSPRASTSPSARQISLGRNPTRISTR